MITKDKYKVCVKCFTYNQASYIEETLNGFCMQETDFPFVCVIMDDASTDGEPEVIRRYMHDYFFLSSNIFYRQEETDDYVLTFAQHKTNDNCFFAIFYLKYNHWSIKNKEPYATEWLDHSRYIAICEGDDYWTDPQKLQKQVNVLDNNSKISLVHTAFKTVNDNGEIIRRPKYDGFIRKSHSGNILPTLFYCNYILTLTMMVRKELFNSQLFVSCPRKFDYAWAFAAAFQGECVFLPDITGCYRKTEGSAITSKFSEVEKGLYQCYKYYVEMFLAGDFTVLCQKSEMTKIYRNILVNLFFHNDYELLKRVLFKNRWSFLLCPEAFAFSMLKKFKRRTYGSTDR